MKYLGSDYNGLNYIVNQLLLVLMLVEGGFSTASVVALFDPVVKNDTNKINQILSFTANAFKKIAIISFIAGTVFSLLISFFIKTNYSYFTVFTVLLFAVATTSYNFLFVSKFNILIQASHDEYLTLISKFLLNLTSQVAAIIIMIFTKNIIVLRFSYLFFAVLTGLAIYAIFKKQYPLAKHNTVYPKNLVAGTKDVFISKVVSVIYTSSPAFYIGIVMGTATTSVYAVYVMVINLVKSVIQTTLSSPQNAIGQIIALGDTVETKKFFKTFETISIMATSILLSCVYALILPFVSLYTSGVTDISYHDPLLAVLLVIIALTELVHIPSGIYINMSGRFDVMRKIQSAACILLIITNTIAALFFGLYGILVSMLIVNIILATLEICYVRRKIFPHFLSDFIKTLLINIVPCGCVSIFLQNLASGYIASIGSFIIFCFISIAILGITNIAFNFIFNRPCLLFAMRKIRKNVFK